MPVRRLLQDFRPRNVRRHQIGRELNPLKLQMKNLRDRPHQQRLGQARRAGDQAVAAGKQADQQLLDHILLPHDHLRQLLIDPMPAAANLLHHLLLK